MASAEYSVLTPERVSLQYDIAGIGSRGAAAIVDTVIQFVSVTVLAFGAFAAGVVGALFGIPNSALGSLMLGLFALAVFVVMAGYYMVFEILWNGQTPGKRLLGVRVMRENGYPIRPVDSVVRNLVRIVDWLPGMYGVGVLTMLLNKRAKRLGDFASGTIVVREGARGAAAAMIPTVSTSRGYALSNSDATLVRDFLSRRVTMNTVARSELAQRLASTLASRYALPVDPDPERFLEELAA
jgi:uncharacterized RDD family membrane protein YckC